MRAECPWHPRSWLWRASVTPVLLAGCADSPGTGALAPMALAALLLAGAAGYAIGHLRTRRELQAQLHQARRDAALAQGLADTWQWQTDAQHQLLHWCPPGPQASSLATGQPLSEAFVDAASLLTRLQSQRPFGPLAARLRRDGSGWLLRGAPRLDEQGCFAGFIGSARPTDEDDAAHRDQAALAALLGHGGQALVLATRAAGQDWVLRHASGEAREQLDALAEGASWAELQARLPATLRQALAAPGNGPDDAPLQAEHWLARTYPLEGGQGLLLWQAPPHADEPPASADDTASLSFTVSHDLRAPIRVVEGFTRILKEDYGRQLDRVGNDHLDRVLGAAARMNHMIDALLTLARLSQQPLTRQPVNLSQLAAYVIDDLRRAQPERAAEVEIEPSLATNGDPTLLRLVLENLLGNAWKYTARCARTRVSFATEALASHPGRRVFVVRDNGAGFDMRSADRLFGLFQRLHSANDFPGTGVGLASVRRIVRRHGGEIWAEAETGRGAAFYFTLRE